MQASFNTLINSFIDNDIGIAENFLPAPLSQQLKNNLLQLYAANQFIAAGTGNNTVAVYNKQMRSDVIYWLDRKHNNIHENTFFDVMDAFVQELNSTCYTSITSYEFHYALYPTGSFYKKHIDQFKSNNSRQFSMMLYLNEGWQPEDGGELCIHHKNTQQKIPPVYGKSVFFKSNVVAHEVLLTHKPRMSITGWLKVNAV